MPTLFIADLHLDEARPHIVEMFERLLAGPARSADALYILGDLFDSWIGDDDDAALATRVSTATGLLRGSGVPVYFIHGNRDFLLGESYAARAGITLLEDGSVVELDGQRTLLMHGDTLCTDDFEYMKFRAMVRAPQWQRQFLARPLGDRRAFAALARDESRRHTSSARAQIMDVNSRSVTEVMRAHGAGRLIHGHTHRPAEHRFEIDGLPARRTVLGDWYEQDSFLAVG